LGLTLRTIPLVTGYVIRTDICTIGTVIFGIVYFAEPATAARMFCVLLILSGSVGLKLVSTN
jgi:quaternary ammonium compound-resistance protein SugE